MKGLPLALKKALKNASRMRSSAIYSPSGALLKEKPHKYGAKRETCLYGHPHASRKEAMWCCKLEELQKEGKIRNLLREPIYELIVNGVVVCIHQPDFGYEKPDPVNWVAEVLDVKGLHLPVWKLKHKLFKAVYPHINYVVV